MAHDRGNQHPDTRGQSRGSLRAHSCTHTHTQLAGKVARWVPTAVQSTAATPPPPPPLPLLTHIYGCHGEGRVGVAPAEAVLVPPAEVVLLWAGCRGSGTAAALKPGADRTPCFFAAFASSRLPGAEQRAFAAAKSWPIGWSPRPSTTQRDSHHQHRAVMPDD